MRWKMVILTIFTLVLILFALFKIGEYRFNSMVAGEIDQLLSQSSGTSGTVITETDLEGLPVPMKKYLRYAGVIGKKPVWNVKLTQNGLFRKAPGDGTMNFTASQYYCTEPGGFLWDARVKMFPGLTLFGRDKYINGQGGMLIKLLALIPVVDAEGFEIDQGSMLRYINEHFWFPTAFLNDYFKWISIDDYTCEAVVQFAGIKARIMYYFNEAGQMINFETERYRSLPDGRSELTRWSTPVRNYRKMNGFFIPTEGQGVWHLPSGNFSYIDLKITDITYNFDPDSL